MKYEYLLKSKFNIFSGGPLMIEGAGLGSFKPEDIGPAEIQSKNGN